MTQVGYFLGDAGGRSHRGGAKLRKNKQIEMKRMKFNKWILALAAVGVIMAASAVRAQTAQTNPPASFWGGLGEAGQAFVNIFKSDTNAIGSTTWVAVPFASYDVSMKKIGGGVAAIYPVANTPLYVGARLENINGTWTTPSLQVQLKKKITVAGMSVTPFGVGGTAIVNGNVAAYVGLGVYVDFVDFTIKSNPASFGFMGDYESWGGLPATCGTKRANAGPCLKLSF